MQESIHGPISFPFAIRNQVKTTLSTFKAARELRTELLSHQRDFYASASREAEAAAIKAYVFGDPDDAARTHHFIDILQQHHIQIYDLARPHARRRSNLPARLGPTSFRPRNRNTACSPACLNAAPPLQTAYFTMSQPGHCPWHLTCPWSRSNRPPRNLPATCCRHLHFLEAACLYSTQRSIHRRVILASRGLCVPV